MSNDEIDNYREALEKGGAVLTSFATKANLILGRLATKKRVLFELRKADIHAKELRNVPDHTGDLESPKKRQKLEFPAIATREESRSDEADLRHVFSSDNISVVKIQWLSDSITENRLLPLRDYLLYEGKIMQSTEEPGASGDHHPVDDDADNIFERARADTPPRAKGPVTRFASAPHGSRKFATQGTRARWADDGSRKKPALVLQETTSDDPSSSAEIPPEPEWVRKRIKYACQRVTPPNPPNDEFIEQLKKIRLARILTLDEIGVRAYSTSIAAIASYPYAFIRSAEITRLPGCDVKIANLWIQFKNTGVIKEAQEVDQDQELQILNKFYEIWGVGAHTAREFFLDRGWRDLDDVVDYGWASLSRVQQIGLKFYDEFQQGIPRSQVEFIGEKVREHAIKVRDEGIEVIIVGGYRRGKQLSADVDIVVSHRELEATANLVEDIVQSLENEGWISHTLLLALTATHRGQSTLPFKSRGVASFGTGFDTLDKALVVWQDPVWPSKAEDLQLDARAKNPNIHRRVDIIISPWRTVGCAVTGWSGGTTFQRDLRRYAKHAKGWKFDSSGVRDRNTGVVIQLEGPNGVSGSMVDAEKAVFAGLGLEYREPHERCTG
jgi:DNA polymerase IV